MANIYEYLWRLKFKQATAMDFINSSEALESTDQITDIMIELLIKELTTFIESEINK